MDDATAAVGHRASTLNPITRQPARSVPKRRRRFTCLTTLIIYFSTDAGVISMAEVAQ